MRFCTTIFVLVLFISLFACRDQPVTDQKIAAPEVRASAPPPVDTIITTLEAMDFYKLLTDKPNIVLLDIRSEAEFKAGHIYRSTNMSPEDPAYLNKISALGRDNDYALYCTSGYRSMQLAEQMKALGFKHIYHLKEGMMHWGQTGQALQLK